jgi:hypothetical protein
MHNDRELIHAALLWHAAHVRRTTIGTARRQLDKEVKACGPRVSPLYLQQAEAARQLTEAKRKELATLRNLAKACAKQRGQFDQVDIIDLDAEGRLLPLADLADSRPTTFEENGEQPESKAI